MNPLRLLFRQKTPYNGLGLIAFCSALSGPLLLEVLFNHRFLWFKEPTLWQEYAFSTLWQGWTTLGVLVTLMWGTDRDYSGLNHDLKSKYSMLLSLLGVSVYGLFGLPHWIWVYQMNLCTAWILFKGFCSALFLMGILSCMSDLICLYTEPFKGLIFSLTLASLIMYLTWGWIG